MRKKGVRERIVGSVKQVDVVLKPSGQRRTGQPVALRIRTRSEGRIKEEWFAVAKVLKGRVRELAAVPEELVGHTFEFILNESGEILEMSRISL